MNGDKFALVMVSLMIVLGYVFSFFMTAGIVWIVCAIGYEYNGQDVLVFTWKCAGTVWVVLLVLNMLGITGRPRLPRRR